MTDKHEQNYNLIEYFLNLLPVLELDGIRSEYTTHNSTQLPDVDNLWIAQEIMGFMDEMPGGFFIYRADGNEELIYANKALLRIFQCSNLKEFRELTGNSFRGLVHPDDLEPVEQSISEQVASSQYDLDYVEYRIIRRDGNVRWVEDYGHFVHTDGVGDFFYVFIADATEKRLRQQAEKSVLIQESRQKDQELQLLIQERDRERTLINQEHLRRLEVIEGLSMNYEAILYTDLDANTILPYRLSARAEHLFEKKMQARSFDGFTQNYVSTWVHPDDRNLVLAETAPNRIRQKLACSKSYTVNYRIQNGQELQFLQLRIVNVGESSHISQLIMGYRRVDDELRQEIEQKQLLEEALSSANLAIIAKNTFLSNMSHDMRTPLNAIFGFTALAKKNLQDPVVTEQYLEKIETSSHQLLELINKVLELSWTESQDFQLAETECSLFDILRDLHQALLPSAREKNITLTMELPTLTHSLVYSDEARLKQLLENLMRNAITYTDTGGTVTVTASELPGLKNHQATYQFTVQDSGIGIAPEFLAHIYEPFEREKNTTYSGVHGSGLGLTITKRLVEKMGGQIHAESTTGMGSTFTVNLPLRVEDAADAPEPSSNNLFSRLLHQKILLVEDNEINLEIETEMLQDLGLRIEPARNGKEALERVQASTPGEYGLILMDIQMPVMNGWEAARAIRSLSDPLLSEIPIIALSANAFESDVHTSRESGMNAHLTKPFDIPLLLECIGKIL